jgi:hypothetical protein
MKKENLLLPVRSSSVSKPNYHFEGMYSNPVGNPKQHVQPTHPISCLEVFLYFPGLSCKVSRIESFICRVLFSKEAFHDLCLHIFKTQETSFVIICVLWGITLELQLCI